VLLPSAPEAAAWFVEMARAAMSAGARLDPASARLLIALAPGDPLLPAALDAIEVADHAGPLASAAHRTSEALRLAVATGDEALAREAVTRLEDEVLQAFRPSLGLGCFEDDVAVAAAMLDAHEVGGDATHLMMAEELMLGVLRRDWSVRGAAPLASGAEAALVLARLAELTGTPEYRTRAIEALEPFAGSFRAHGLAAAPFVSALQAIS
jgi:uncharacterized protein YyaL (SSP411 family)